MCDFKNKWRLHVCVTFYDYDYRTIWPIHKIYQIVKTPTQDKITREPNVYQIIKITTQ